VGLSPSHPGPSHPGPSHLGPSHLGPSHPGPSHLGPSHPGPSHPGPSHPSLCAAELLAHWLWRETPLDSSGGDVTLHVCTKMSGFARFVVMFISMCNADRDEHYKAMHSGYLVHWGSSQNTDTVVDED